jgi:hypothetical protein
MGRHRVLQSQAINIGFAPLKLGVHSRFRAPARGCGHARAEAHLTRVDEPFGARFVSLLRLG